MATVPDASVADARGAGDRLASPELRLRPGRPSQRAADPARHASAFRAGQRIPAGDAETARLLVLLVEFPEDTDPNTTGDGRFQLEPDDTYETNRPPHDHPYFDRQCQALDHYLDAASGGRLRITWDLSPTATATPRFYEMPRPMRYYNPDTTDAALNLRLAEFFRDAITVADESGVAFDAYDYYTIFHAGVGQDLLIDDSTPSDIVSAFLSFEELRDYLGEDEDWPGIAVQGGAHHVTEGLWLPETENQEGFEFALTGVFAQLMGSQLGLPVLFNPDSGAPGIGRFGLMDQGGGNLLGKSPALVCGWSRFDLGWGDAVVVTNGEDVGVRARGVLDGGADLVIVPVDDREYFLIETRKKELDGNGTFTILLDETVPIAVEGDEYDYGIPGSGLLIWHIDQDVIDATRDDNRVNADFRRRGVKLLEADGLDEIGLYPEGGFGLPEDAFFAGNNDALTPESTPSSRSNQGRADTGVFVTAIGDTGGVMTCTIRSALSLPGWPDDGGDVYTAISPVSGDVDGDGSIEVVLVDETTVRIVDQSGSGRVIDAEWSRNGENDVLVADVIAGDDAAQEILTAFEDGSLAVRAADGGDAWSVTALLLPPRPGRAGTAPLRVAVADIDDDGAGDVFAATGERLHHWQWSVALGRFVAESVELGVTSAVTGLAVDSDRLIVSHGSGEIESFVFGPGDGLVTRALEAEFVAAIGGESGVPARLGRTSAAGEAVLVTLTSNGTLAMHRFEPAAPGSANELRMLPGWPVALESAESRPALGDVNRDGRLDVVVGDVNRARALGVNGVRLDGWPVTLSAFDPLEDPVATEPLIADLDRNGTQDVLVACPDGLLRAFDGEGRVLDGWPRPAGRTHGSTPVVSGLGGGAVVAANVGRRWSYAAFAPDAHADAHWGAAGGSSARGNALDASGFVDVVDVDSFFAEDDLVVYPTPAYDDVTFRYVLGSDAEVTITVYDVTGLRVAELSAPGLGGVPNERSWDLRSDEGDRVAPGLYLVRVTARGAESVVHETKMAVAR